MRRVPTFPEFPIRVVVDLGAIRANTAALIRRAGGAQFMAMVKARGYAHGAIPCARAAVQAGATWVGTAQLVDALEVRDAIGGVKVLTWIYAPGAPFARAIDAGIDLGVSGRWALEEIAAAARACGRAARVHLKIDTGMGRAGIPPAAWERTVDAALAMDGAIDVVGCWSHFACADEPNHPSVAAQKDVFAWAVEVAEARGARFEVRHIANSAALLTDAGATWDMVRPGLAMYGLSPIPDLASPADLGLRPAMRLESVLSLVKDVPAGQGVSYGLTYRTESATVLGVVPAGYADGVPRHASNAAPVQVGGRRRRIAGRVCMDQFVVDLGPGAADRPGDRVILFGPGDDGEPTAEDWARASGTISYEVLSRIPEHIPRVYLGEH
ncbi:MAG: alanine racemase [Bifidobacteriaceae bacterium]|nr:alanine racemase [Bifidobacteriaceae bacterium]